MTKTDSFLISDVAVKGAFLAVGSMEQSIIVSMFVNS